MPRDDIEENGFDFLTSAVREHAGAQGVARLMRELGWITLSVPAEPDDEHPLTRVFGIKLAHSICRQLSILNGRGLPKGLGTVRIPQGRFSRSEMLRAEIKRLAQTGELRAPEIALRLRCHERTVWRVLADLRKVGKLPPGRILWSAKP